MLTSLPHGWNCFKLAIRCARKDKQGFAQGTAGVLDRAVSDCAAQVHEELQVVFQGPCKESVLCLYKFEDVL